MLVAAADAACIWEWSKIENERNRLGFGVYKTMIIEELLFFFYCKKALAFQPIVFRKTISQSMYGRVSFVMTACVWPIVVAVTVSNDVNEKIVPSSTVTGKTKPLLNCHA